MIRPVTHQVIDVFNKDGKRWVRLRRRTDGEVEEFPLHVVCHDDRSAWYSAAPGAHVFVHPEALSYYGTK